MIFIYNYITHFIYYFHMSTYLFSSSIKIFIHSIFPIFFKNHPENCLKSLNFYFELKKNTESI